MLTGTHGVGHTQSQRKVMDMQHCHSYLHKTLVTDGAREQAMGEFRHKARQADCHVKQTEPYSPWQNAAERTTRAEERYWKKNDQV